MKVLCNLSMAAVASPAAGYVWEDPGDSIMIQVSLDLVERLGAVVQQGLGAGARGNEIGGILLGRTLPGFGQAVLIEDFELAPCEHLRGASYTLSPLDKRELGRHLASRPARQVVGYFRSHTRPGMYLDQDDFAVFSRYFPEVWQVFLLVRPAADGPATGGFFFWEDGEVNRRSPYRQFPFDCARLAEGNFPITGGQPVAVPAPAPAPRPLPVLVPKAEPRARRRLPSLPWVVVPTIAVLFLIAGLFVSQNQEPVHQAAAVKAIPPVEPLLPEPVPGRQAEAGTPAPSVEQVTQEGPAAVSPVSAVPKPRPAKKAVPAQAAGQPVAEKRAPVREVEAPPALAAPVARLETRLAPVLVSVAHNAPPAEAEVSYDAAHVGPLRGLFHKIDVPASPIKKVAPMKPADAGADTRPVDVKAFIDDTGIVTRVQLLTKGSDYAEAALNAARQWQFTPARKHDKPVASEMVLHFRF